MTHVQPLAIWSRPRVAGSLRDGFTGKAIAGQPWGVSYGRPRDIPLADWTDAETVADRYRLAHPAYQFAVAGPRGPDALPHVVTDEGLCCPLWELLDGNAPPDGGEMEPAERAEIAEAIMRGEVAAVGIGGGWSTISPADKLA